MKLLLYAISIMLLLLSACDLEKEIDIKLPDYETQLVVECYLEPGQPFTLSLSKSAAYFDPLPTLDSSAFDKLLEQGAQVTITHSGKIFVLEEGLFLNPFTQKIFNYYSRELVPSNFEQPFHLKITTKEGKTIEATTKILPVVPIDSIVVEFAETDTLARVLTYLTDDPGQDNFYRRMLHNVSLDSVPEQDFVLDDRIVDNRVLAFGTAFDYAVGDTVINTIFHLDQTYYNFLESVFNARDSNGNPFGQPSPILSSLSGTANAIGIFTGLSYDREVTIIRK